MLLFKLTLCPKGNRHIQGLHPLIQEKLVTLLKIKVLVQVASLFHQKQDKNKTKRLYILERTVKNSCYILDEWASKRRPRNVLSALGSYIVIKTRLYKVF